MTEQIKTETNTPPNTLDSSEIHDEPFIQVKTGTYEREQAWLHADILSVQFIFSKEGDVKPFGSDRTKLSPSQNRQAPAARLCDLHKIFRQTRAPQTT